MVNELPVSQGTPVIFIASAFRRVVDVLASGGEEDGTVLTWNVGSWEHIKAYTGYGKSDMVPSYSSEGVLCVAAVSYGDDTVTVWDLGKQRKTLHCRFRSICGVFGWFSAGLPIRT